MADPTMQQLAFSPTPMGPAQSFQPGGGAGVVTPNPAQPMDPEWMRIMDMYKRGLVSPQQFQQAAAKYGQSSSPAPQPQAPQGGMAGLGQVAGDIIGRSGQALAKFAGGDPAPSGPSPQWNR